MHITKGDVEMDQITNTRTAKPRITKTHAARALFIILMLIYVISPDALPGPVDDVLVFLLSMAAQKGLRLPE